MFISILFLGMKGNCCLHRKTKPLEAIYPHEHLSRYPYGPWLHECAFIKQDLVI